VIPPDDAEQSVLGAVLLRNEAISRVHLRPDDFFDLRHQSIWRAMLALAGQGKPIDPVMLEGELNGRFEKIGGYPFISDLLSSNCTADNIEHYAQRVRDAAFTRSCHLAASEILRCGLEGAELRAYMKERLGQLERDTEQSRIGTRAYGMGVGAFLGDEEEADGDGQDWIVRGLILRAAPNIFAGTPKSRKTLLALHLMISIAAGFSTWLGRFPITQTCVLVLAHEDSRRETRRRIWRLARGMGIDPRSLENTLRIADRSDPFHFDSPAEMARMTATLETWKPGVVLMDSLSRMHVGDENSKRDMNVVTDAWLTMAARYDLALVSIHHLVKIAETKSLILQLRGSGDIGAAVRHAVGIASDTKVPDRSRIWTEGNQQYQPDPFDVDVIDDFTEQGKPTIRLEIAAKEGEEAGSKLEEAIISALAGGPLGARGLRTACKGYRASAVDETARALEAKKRLKRAPGGAAWMLL
jgi:hypothetical protein